MAERDQLAVERQALRELRSSCRSGVMFQRAAADRPEPAVRVDDAPEAIPLDLEGRALPGWSIGAGCGRDSPAATWATSSNRVMLHRALERGIRSARLHPRLREIQVGSGSRLVCTAAPHFGAGRR